VLNIAHTGFDHLGVGFCYGLRKSWKRVTQNFPLIREAFKKQDVLKWIREECIRCWGDNSQHRHLHDNLSACQDFDQYLKRCSHPVLGMDRNLSQKFWVGIYFIPHVPSPIWRMLVHFTQSNNPDVALSQWINSGKLSLLNDSIVLVLDSSSDLLLQHVNAIRTHRQLTVYQHPFGVRLPLQQKAECAIHLIQRCLSKNPQFNEVQLEDLLNRFSNFKTFLKK